MKKIKTSKASWLVIGVLGIFAIGGIVFAAGNSITNNFYDNSTADQRATADEAGVNFGGVTAEDEIFTAGVAVEGLLGAEGGIGQGSVDDNMSLTNGYIMKVANIDLSATSSAVLLNPEGETIYVYDATARIQTATTTASTAYLMGTSTSSGIEQALLCGATGVCGTATSKEASILNTGAITPVALDTYFKADYQGTDTRDGSGTRFVVPVLSSEYLFCGVSTTPALNGQTGGQATQCQFKYYVIED